MEVAIFVLYEVIIGCVLLSYWYMAMDQIAAEKKLKELTVKELRKNGYKVRVHHHRKVVTSTVAARGGKTVVEVTTPDGVTFIGIARCSRKENFNKKMGVRIALGRALKNK